MIDTDEYEDAKKTVEDAGLIDDNDGWLDVHYRKIAHLLAEVKRLKERLDWILGDEELAAYVWEKEVAYMEHEGVRLPWISADEWGEE
tara:strand:- start:515 stop:778 length:264 start_codon:yes stop_codon:yes gene_type:complete